MIFAVPVCKTQFSKGQLQRPFLQDHVGGVVFYVSIGHAVGQSNTPGTNRTCSRTEQYARHKWIICCLSSAAEYIAWAPHTAHSPAGKLRGQRAVCRVQSVQCRGVWEQTGVQAGPDQQNHHSGLASMPADLNVAVHVWAFVYAWMLSFDMLPLALARSISWAAQ